MANVVQPKAIHPKNTDTEAGRIHTEQLRMLYRQMPAISIIVFICATVFSGLYAQASTSNTLLFIWLTCFGALSLSRVIAGFTFQSNKINPTKIATWLNFVLISSFLNGCLWGYAIVVFNPELILSSTTVMHHQLFLAAAVTGITIATVSTYSYYFPAFLLFIIPIAVPTSIHAYALHDIYGTDFSLACILFATILIYTARQINITTMEALDLQVKNESLIHYLDNAKEALQHAHDGLEQDVTARTAELNGANNALSESESRLTLAMEFSNTGLWDWDISSGTMYLSEFNNFLDIDKSEVNDFIKDIEAIAHPEDYPRVKGSIVHHLKNSTKTYREQYRVRTSDGTWRWIEDEGRAISRDGKIVTRMIGTRRDITEQKINEEDLQLASTVLESVSDAVFILDHKFRVIRINPYFTKISQYEWEDVKNKYIFKINFEFFKEKSTVEESKALFSSVYASIQSTGYWHGEIDGYKKDGSIYPQWLRINAVYNDKQELSHYVGLFSDLTSRKEAEDRLQYLSHYDQLTGLANRDLFRDRLHQAMDIARSNTSKIALIYIDLDRFKQINETLGHEVGDKLLDEAAKRLINLKLNADTVSRVGGDEFTIVLEDYSSIEEIVLLCTEVITSMKRPFVIGTHELLLGTSIGVSLYPDNAKELQILLNRADIAMHQAKRLGGNNYQFYTEDLQTATVEQLNLETSLRKAIFKDEFLVYYQPKLDLLGNKITSAEALVRWNHPEQGIISPTQFIQLAEETGLIAAIGELVLERACTQAKQWKDSGLGTLRVSVNLSAAQLRKGNLLEIIDRVLTNTGLDSSQLEFELTESILMDDVDQTINLLHQIKERGIVLSLDDFGTGYSSLSYLKKFPIDILKIDQAFVKDVDTNADDAAIITAIIAMAHSLNMKVVAEGVETKEHLDFLRSRGCDSVQGYLISRPVPKKDMDRLLREQEQSISA